MRLYGYWRSSSSWRVRIALRLKGIEFEYRPVHLVKAEQHSESYVEKNTMHQVPTLEVEEGGRSVHLSQSLAIIVFLNERHPKPPLIPSDPLMRTRAWELAEICNSGMQPFHNLATLQAVEALGTTRKAWVAPFLEKGLAAMEKLVQETSQTYCIGSSPSLADVCLVPQLYSVRRFGVDLSPYPNLLRIEGACSELPAFEAAHPSRQPDAPKED